MIVKKIKNQKIEKPKSWQIGDLIDYIRFPHNKKKHRKKSKLREGEIFFPQLMLDRKLK